MSLTKINPTEAARLLQDGAILVDIRDEKGAVIAGWWPP